LNVSCLTSQNKTIQHGCSKIKESGVKAGIPSVRRKAGRRFFLARAFHFLQLTL
jgi:hypothetical protein